MWARKRIDITWADLAAAIGWCVTPANRALVRQRLEQAWSLTDEGLACLSVRTGWDLLLSAARFPRGSEVLVSSVTIPDMMRIIEHHGLVPVPLDLDPDTTLPSPASIAERTTPRTKAVLIAHLFGTSAPLDEHIAVARERGLLFVEDCAQAFRGREYPGHPHADASLFSFGTIKTATALGGALLTVRRPELLSEMRRRQSEYPVQTHRNYLGRVLKYCVLKAAATRTGFALLLFGFRILGRDYDQALNASIRGFPADRLFDLIRQQPSTPLLRLLRRRITGFNEHRQQERTERGRRLVASLEPSVTCPAGNVAPHVYWVFPILTHDPEATRRLLFQHGFDSTQGQSMIVVPPPEDRPEYGTPQAHSLLPRLLFLPFYAAIPERELQRMADVLVNARPGNYAEVVVSAAGQVSRETR